MIEKLAHSLDRHFVSHGIAHTHVRTHTHTPALCIMPDTEVSEMECINKVQSEPLPSLIQREEKELFIFLYPLFLIIFKTLHLYKAVS